MRKVISLLVLLATPAFAVNFPTSLDDDTTLYNLSNGDVYIAQYHNAPKDAIIALQNKVGINSSAVVTSLDYLVKTATNPGHTHTTSSVTILDGTDAAPGLTFGNPVTDTDTGFFHPGDGAVSVSANGVEITRVTGTGLGILNAAPDFALDVAGLVRIQSANKLCFGGTGAGDNDTCVYRGAAHVARVDGSVRADDQAVGDATLTLNGIAAKTGNFLTVKLLPADANPAVSIDSAAKLWFGAGGGTAVDTNLYRSAVNTLKTDDVFIAGSGLTTNGNLTIADAQNVVLDTTTGTKFGTATGQKLGFFNATPVVQPTASTALVTLLQNLGLIAAGTYSGDIATTGTVTLGGLVGTQQAITLANGANNNIAVNAGTTSIRFTGPTAAYNLTGLTGGTEGRVLFLHFVGTGTLTWTNDATSTAANRFLTSTNADVTCQTGEGATGIVVYDGTAQRWWLHSTVNCPAAAWP